MATIVEDQPIGRVDGQQLEPFLQVGAEAAKFGFVEPGKDEQGRAGVKLMPIQAEAVAAPAGLCILLEDGHVEPGPGQVDGGGDAADAGPDHQDGGRHPASLSR